MDHLIRPRGVIAAFADGRRGEPRAVLAELGDAFTAFKQRYNERQETIEASLDDMAGTIAAMRVGGGDASARGPSAAALRVFGEFAKSGKPQAGMTTDSDPDGGYMIPEEVGTEIIRRQIDRSPMRRLATVRTIRSDTFEQLVNTGGAEAEWVGERESRPETDNPTLESVKVSAQEIYANPSVSARLLDDSAFDVGGFVADTIADAFDLKEGAAWISGSGVEQPRGFLSLPAPVTTADASRDFGVLQYVPTGVAAAISDGTHNGGDALIDLTYTLRAGYRQNASWLMNSATAGIVRKLKSIGDTANYLWQNSIAAGQPPLLCGYPVVFDENMPDVGANAFPIAFGDFRRGYLIVDRVGVRITRDPYTNKPYVMFYTTKRVGGGPLDTNAIKLLKVAAS